MNKDTEQINILIAELQREVAKSNLDKDIAEVVDVFVEIFRKMKEVIDSDIKEIDGKRDEKMLRDIGAFKESIKRIEEKSASKKQTESVKVEFLKKIDEVYKALDKISLTPGAKGEPGEKGNDGSSDTPAQVKEKLLKEGLKIEDIKDLRKELDKLEKIRKSWFSPMVAGGLSAKEMIKDVDLSSQLDGVTKVFNIPAVWNIISVDLSSFPYALRKNVDYTYTQTTITFTDQVDAPSSLASGQTCVLTVVT